MQKTGSFFKIEKSTCSKFIRIWLDTHVEIMPISDWSKALAKAGEFRHNVELKPVVPATPTFDYNPPDCA